MVLAYFFVLFFYLGAAFAQTRPSPGPCLLGVSKLEVPSNIRNGVPFPVTFCSAAQTPTSPHSIAFTWGFRNEIDGANPVVEMTPNWPTGYVFNATVSYPQIGGKIYLGVLEKINGYMVSKGYRWYSKEVWIS